MQCSRRLAGRVVRFALCLPAVVALGACGDGDSTPATTGSSIAASTSTAPTALTSVPPDTSPSTTLSMGSNVESLSYLIQGLLTTDQIGGGWVDQGRQVIPPGSNQLSGFLCPDGETAVERLGGRLDPQVSVSFRRPGDVGLVVFETLMWGGRDEVVADFESFAAAVESCAGSNYDTADLGELALVVDEAPSLGTSALAFSFGPASPSLENPWLEQWSSAVLLTDPSQPIAVVVGIGVSVVHDPAAADTTEIDPAEYERILDAAVGRILDGL